MAFTYTGNPADSILDALRFMLRDTDIANALLTDEEINYIVANYKTINMQLAIGFRQCAATLSRQAIKRSLGPSSEDNTKRVSFYEAMADKYEKLSAVIGASPLPAYQHDIVFSKGMMENV